MVIYQDTFASHATQSQKEDQQKLYPEILYSGQNDRDVYKQPWPDGEAERLPLEPSLKLRDHSPTGFSWSGTGSGCAQLALALLLDATLDPVKACAFYYEFKVTMVSGFEKEWMIFRTNILNWLELMEARDLASRQGKN